MTPSHLDRHLRSAEQMKIGKSSSNNDRRWRLGVRLGGRFFRKLILVGACVSLIVYISNLDPGGVEYDNSGNWNWNSADMAVWMSNMSDRMELRRQHLRTMCSITQLNQKLNDSLHQPNVWEFLINRKHHLLWCNVFKAASTSWMYNFNILAGYKPKFLQTTKQVPLQLARQRYPRPTLQQLLEAQNDSTTFLIVRHPLERLLSGYRDKIENALAHTYHHKLNTEIILRYRKDQSQGKNILQKRYGKRKTPTFSEFVDYIIDQNKWGNEFDMHWTPINGFCTPCQVHFDIIMKFETLEEDQNYLIHSQKLERWIRPQWKNPSKGRSKTTNLVSNYFSQLSTDQVYELYNIYRYDFQLFNYTLDGYIDHSHSELTEGKSKSESSSYRLSSIK